MRRMAESFASHPRRVTERSSNARAGTGPARRSTASARLLGVDVARALALFLIMVAHVLPFETDDGGLTWAYRAGSYGLALFVLLAGVGVGLSNPDRGPATSAARLRSALSLGARAIAIAVVGLLLGSFVDYEEHAVVVLMSFGMLFVLAIPLLRASPPLLGVLAVAAAVVVPVVAHLARPALPTPELVNPTLVDVVRDPLPWLSQLSLTGVYPALAWVSYLCAGMVVARLDLRSVPVLLRLVGFGVGLALVAQFASSVLLYDGGGVEHLAEAEDVTADEAEAYVAWGPATDAPRESAWWLAVDAPHSSAPLDLAHTTGTALVVVGLCGLVDQLAPSGVLRPLAAVGSMTLTLYALHLFALTWFPDAWGYFSTFAAHVVAMLIVANIWLRFFDRGPIETVIRSLERSAQSVAGWSSGRVLRR